MSPCPLDENASRRTMLLDIYGLLLADASGQTPDAALATIFEIIQQSVCSEVEQEPEPKSNGVLIGDAEI